MPDKMFVVALVVSFLIAGAFAFQQTVQFNKEVLVTHRDAYKACLDTQIKLAENIKKSGGVISLPTCYGMK